jgi:hypothetical protein
MMRVAMEVERRQSRNRAGLKMYTAMNTRIENMIASLLQRREAIRAILLFNEVSILESILHSLIGSSKSCNLSAVFIH